MQIPKVTALPVSHSVTHTGPEAVKGSKAAVLMSSDVPLKVRLVWRWVAYREFLERDRPLGLFSTLFPHLSSLILKQGPPPSGKSSPVRWPDRKGPGAHHRRAPREKGRARALF